MRFFLQEGKKKIANLKFISFYTLFLGGQMHLRNDNIEKGSETLIKAAKASVRKKN